MLDHLSYGRLELGVGRGVSPIESRIFGYNSIEESRERYRATLDTFFAACASPVMKVSGVEAELHLKPYQKPYPPLWFPSSNKESIEFTARHGYNTAFIGKHADCKPMFERYRELWEKHRNDPGRHNAHVAAPFLARTQHLVIADTDAEAEKLGLQAYETWAGHIHHLTRKLGRPDVHKTTPYDEDSAQRLIAGSPQTALEKLEEMLRLTGANYLLCIFSFGWPRHPLARALRRGSHAEARQIISLSVPGSTGLVRCASKPASRARCTSPSPPQPVSAISRVAAAARAQVPRATS